MPQPKRCGGRRGKPASELADDAVAIAESVTDAELRPEFVVPSVFDRSVVERVAPAVAAASFMPSVMSVA
ncbi:MAG: hypothetical protein ACKORY_02175, partial [Actinomycetota bacterium]